MSNRDNLAVDFQSMASLKHWGESPELAEKTMKRRSLVHCGWGRVLFGHTYADHQALIEDLNDEDQLRSDVVFYCREPQVLVSKAPHQLFIDPSLTYRLDLSGSKPEVTRSPRLRVRTLMGGWDEYNINKLLLDLGRVDLGDDFTHKMFADPSLSVLIAEDEKSGQLLGCVFGIDHKLAFDDPDNGSSAWSLAVVEDSPLSGVASALISELAKRFREKGRQFLDWSIVHDEQDDCLLAENMGFARVPVYSVKNRNAVNEPLYTSEAECQPESLSAQALPLVEQARRLGISVQIHDAARDLFSLQLAGQSVRCKGALTELTSAVALQVCEDLHISNSLLRGVDVAVPAQCFISTKKALEEFAKPFISIDLLPAVGNDDGQALLGLKTEADLEAAWHVVQSSKLQWVARESIFGQKIDVLVIGGDVFAAKVGGRFLDHSEPCREKVISPGSTHNSEDVTQRLHPVIKRAALMASQALGVQVVALEMTVASACQPDYKVTLANPRPALNAFAPQPVIEHWLKFLFPSLATAIEMKRTF
ncbi:N-acetyltransferase [Ferrimonas futtsuensis]|uniref:N-acetyltransferase n=1 Tax=Ferrimonas futtsuensis TaxID=364764 RepID=UPI000417BF20|nr:N-acetyltransferase [Ferrimonas futtsuensis]